ncbi:MAG TPA: hypothetical protein VGC97_12830 [Pyrinomonadaceae bacterium]|jgi:hypothetical protein
MNELNPEDFLKDLPLQAEEIGFKPDELVACPSCARNNPPTRLKCMYCGAQLEISTEQAAKIAPNLRKLEAWESGFNLIYVPPAGVVSPENAAEIAKLVGMESEVFQTIIESQKNLPLARVETLREAEILQNRLKETRLETVVISDERLAPEVQPVRLRALEFRGETVLLIHFNTNEIDEIHAEDLVLLVSGVIVEKAVESTEGRKKGVTRILDATETASDDILIDIYSKFDGIGYRILTKGFDFSCLEWEKGILARDNINKLFGRLQVFAPHAKRVNDYLAVRGVLGEIWEVEQRRDSKGLTRQRFGKFDLSNVSSSSNLQQFTKYSRLQRHLL